METNPRLGAMNGVGHPVFRAVVAGATSQIGVFLLPRLTRAGFQVDALSRAPPVQTDSGVDWQRVDLGALPSDWCPPEGATWFHLAGLPLLPPVLRHLAAARLGRIIAFGSTSRFTKQDSPVGAERATAAALARAEAEVTEWCERHRVPWTIFRPTLVYGCGRDQNVHAIRQFIRRYGFFPLPGPGNGLRQPVHADDLAAACVQAWRAPATHHRAYNLSGGETLRYRELVRAVFAREQRPARLVPVPLPLLKLGLRVARWLPRYRHATPAMADRMERDLCFDHADARRDFGYQPRTFQKGLWS